ncbi:Vesicle transport protein S20 [Sorochytrium milnesiophthora]
MAIAMSVTSRAMEAQLQDLSRLLDAAQTELNDVISGSQGDIYASQQALSRIRSTVKQASQDLNHLAELAEEIHRPTDRQQAKMRVELFGKQIEDLTVQARKATALLRQRSLAEAKRQQKELLGSGSGDTRVRQRRKSATDENVRKAASETTNAMRQISRMMAVEVAKSAQNVSSLDQQTKILQDTHNEYQNLGGILKQTVQAVSKLEFSQRMDRLWIALGTLAFVAVVLYILNRRVFSWFLPT